MEKGSDNERRKGGGPSEEKVDSKKSDVSKILPAAPGHRSAVTGDVAIERPAATIQTLSPPSAFMEAKSDTVEEQEKEESSKTSSKEDAAPNQSPFRKSENSMKPVWEQIASGNKSGDSKLPPWAVPSGDSKPPARKAPQFSSEGWKKPVVIKLPRHFPLESSNVEIQLEDSSVNDVVLRLSESFKASFKVMSIQVKFMNQPASAALLSSDNVEMYLALWKSRDEKALIVEVQPRQGDSVIAYQYARYILSVASGTFDSSAFSTDEDSILYLQSTEAMLNRELSKLVPDRDVEKESTAAIQVVYDLLQRNRRDARRLGMEGICIIVNARKTVLTAAIRASRALLLGNDQSEAEQGIHDFVLGVLLKRSFGHDEPEGEYPVDSDDENYFVDNDEALQNHSPEFKEELTLLTYLAFDALARALEVATTFDLNVPTNPTVLEDASSALLVVSVFLAKAKQQTETDVLDILLQTVQAAHLKPHNAWLATKCLRYICSVSPEAKETMKKHIGAIGEAYEVGCTSHAKLEAECRMLQAVLGN